MLTRLGIAFIVLPFLLELMLLNYGDPPGEMYDVITQFALWSFVAGAALFVIGGRGDGGGEVRQC